MPVTYFVGQQVKENSKFDKLLLVKDVVGDVASAINSKASAADVTSLTTSVAGKASAASVTALTSTVSGKASKAELTAAVDGLVGSAVALTTLNALKAELTADDSITNVILNNLSSVTSQLQSDLLTLKAKDGSSDNYQISTQGNGSVDSLFISKGGIPLMEISSRGVVNDAGETTTDVITFSAPVVMNNLSLSGPLNNPTPIVYAPCGKVSGAQYNPFQSINFPLEYFSCIQYAKTPSGALRLMPAVPMPRSATLINGTVNPFIFDATRTTYPCGPAQKSIPLFIALGDPILSQVGPIPPILVDMINNNFSEAGSVMLDVVRRPNTKVGANLPVMVFIHGGGKQEGTRAGYGGICNTIIMEHDVIVVNIDYRLALLGWTPFKEFTAPPLGDAKYNQINGVFSGMEQFAGACGNQGITDCIVALQWVKKNISAFGGNPDNVTVIGHSAGGMLADLLQMTPLCDQSTPERTLFHKIIAMAGVTSGNRTIGMSGGSDWMTLNGWNTNLALGRNDANGGTSNPAAGVKGGFGVPKYTTSGTDSYGVSYVSGDYYRGDDLVTYISGASPTGMTGPYNTWNTFSILSGCAAETVYDGVVLPYPNQSDIFQDAMSMPLKIVDVPIMYTSTANEAALYSPFLSTGLFAAIAKADLSTNPNANPFLMGDLSFLSNILPNLTEACDNASYFQMHKGTLVRKHFGAICGLYGLDGETATPKEYTWINVKGLSVTETFGVFKLFHAAVGSAVIVAGSISSITVMANGHGYALDEVPVVTIVQKKIPAGGSVETVSVTTAATATAVMELAPGSTTFRRVKSITVDGVGAGYKKSMILFSGDGSINWVEVAIAPPAAKASVCPPIAAPLVGQKYTKMDTSDMSLTNSAWNQYNIIVQMESDLWSMGAFEHAINLSGGEPSYMMSSEAYFTGTVGGLAPTQFDSGHMSEVFMMANSWDWKEGTVQNIMCDFIVNIGAVGFLNKFGYPSFGPTSLANQNSQNYGIYVPSASDKSVAKRGRQAFANFAQTGYPGFPSSSTGNGFKICLDADLQDASKITPVNEFHNDVIGQMWSILYGQTIAQSLAKVALNLDNEPIQL